MVAAGVGGGDRLIVALCSPLEAVLGNRPDFYCADAGLAAHGAGNEAAATLSVGRRPTGWVRRLSCGRMAFPGGRTACLGDNQAAAHLAACVVAAVLGRQRLALAPGICVRFRNRHAAPARRGATDFAGMVANVRRGTGEVSPIHAGSVCADFTFRPSYGTDSWSCVHPGLRNLCMAAAAETGFHCGFWKCRRACTGTHHRYRTHVRAL